MNLECIMKINIQGALFSHTITELPNKKLLSIPKQMPSWSLCTQLFPTPSAPCLPWPGLLRGGAWWPGPLLGSSHCGTDSHSTSKQFSRSVSFTDYPIWLAVLLWTFYSICMQGASEHFSVGNVPLGKTNICCSNGFCVSGLGCCLCHLNIAVKRDY